MKHKLKPRFVTIARPLSPISWFNHWIGETFEVLNISEHDFVEIEHMNGWKGWVPLDCCEKHFFRPLPKAIESAAMLSEAVAE